MNYKKILQCYVEQIIDASTGKVIAHELIIRDSEPVDRRTANDDPIENQKLILKLESIEKPTRLELVPPYD